MRQKRYALNSSKYLLDTELRSFKKTLNKFRKKNPRDTLILDLALSTGARAQELLNIRPADVNSHDESVLIRGLKGSNDREIPLQHSLFKQLTDCVQASQSPHIFNIGYNRLRQIWQDFRPVNKSFHSLRHTFAIELYKKTRDLRLVQVALGHRNIANTMIYAEYVYSKEEMRRLIL